MTRNLKKLTRATKHNNSLQSSLYKVKEKNFPGNSTGCGKNVFYFAKKPFIAETPVKQNVLR